MAVNLTKGQRVSLTKDNDGLKAIMVGLGWDPLEEKQEKGFFSNFFRGLRKPLTVMPRFSCLKMTRWHERRISFILEICRCK